MNLDKKKCLERRRMTNHKLKGKANRAKGYRFERKVRRDLEKKGYIVDKFTNNIKFYLEATTINGKKIEVEVIGDVLHSKGRKYEGEPICGELVEKGRLVPAKRNKWGMSSTGFPDYIAWKARTIYNLPPNASNEEVKRFVRDLEKVKNKEVIVVGGSVDIHQVPEIIGVEVKSNGQLTQVEKKKIKWLLENKVFETIYIVRKGNKRGEIIYEDFREVYQEKEDGTIRKTQKKKITEN
jgi:hypothetical protein